MLNKLKIKFNLEKKLSCGSLQKLLDQSSITRHKIKY